MALERIAAGYNRGMAEGSTAQLDVAGAALYCPQCMYDLRGLSGASCPECGAALDRETLARSSLPWVHAGFVMRLFPPVRTAWRVILQPRALSQEMARPGDLRAAMRFRRSVVWWVWLTLAAAWLLGVWGFELEMFELREYDDIGWVDVIDEHFDENQDHANAFSMWSTLLLGGLTWLYLYLATGVHTYWMHPKHLPEGLQERSLALSYYASAPLLLLLLPAALLLAGLVVDESDLVDMAGPEYKLLVTGLIFGGMLLLVLVLLLWLLRCVRYAGLLAQRSVPGQLLMAGALPLCWLGLAALVYGVLPAVAFFVYAVWATV